MVFSLKFNKFRRDSEIDPEIVTTVTEYERENVMVERDKIKKNKNHKRARNWWKERKKKKKTEQSFALVETLYANRKSTNHSKVK